MTSARRRPPPAQVRRTEPADRRSAVATDRRRLVAATLSAVLPGLGQWFNGRARLARRFLVPTLAVVVLVLLVSQLVSPARLVATVVNPAVLQALLVLNVLALAWRLLAVGQAFFDGRYASRPGGAGAIGLLVLALLVAIPHGLVNAYGLAAQDTFGRVFAGDPNGPGGPADPTPALPASERLNVLIIGIDAAPTREAVLTDSMMVASLDPVGRTVSLVSVPRDLINVPLGNGNVYGPKLNSLMAYADRHPNEFPRGGIAALQQAIGALLEIPIHHYALMDFAGFVKMIDAVGGIDVTVTKAWRDPLYDGMGLDGQGFGLDVGEHHLNGWEALAYARARRGPGESDFTRAGRQQEVLVALRNRVTANGVGLVFQVPALLDAVGDLVVTDMPVGRLPDLAALVDEVPNESIYRAVIRPPLTAGRSHPQYGSVQVGDLPAIRAVAAAIFPEPGGVPVAWPTPVPSPTPAAVPTPPAPDGR